MTGHSGQFTPGGHLSTVIRTTLAGIEPTTFRLLVRRDTSRATEATALGDFGQGLKCNKTVDVLYKPKTYNSSLCIIFESFAIEELAVAGMTCQYPR